MAKKFSVGMEGESDSRSKQKLPEGEHIMIIKDVVLVRENQSKSGNPYFRWDLKSKKEGIEMPVYTTLIKGKRWLLKQILFACGIEADDKDPDQKYQFDEEDVVKKEVVAVIKHEPNEFVGRDGNVIKHLKAVVKSFRKVDDIEFDPESGQVLPDENDPPPY